MKTAAILLLAGASTRFDAKENKLIYLLNNKPVFSYSLLALANSKLISEVVVVTSQHLKSKIADFIKQNNLSVRIVLGGLSRQESVNNGLKSLNLEPNDLVLIHDGARPLIDEKIISELIENTKKFGASTTYIEECDTLATFNNQKIVEFVDRNKIIKIQTPQCFRFDIIKKAHSVATDNSATDDCSLVKKIGYDISLIRGDKKLQKITTIDDVKILEGLVK